MIIHNTLWSMQFLQRWWDKVDRIKGMDQHVFDVIYHDLLHNHQHHDDDGDDDDHHYHGVGDHIVLLDYDEINSHIPAFQHQKPSSNILHLAGR